MKKTPWILAIFAMAALPVAAQLLINSYQSFPPAGGGGLDIEDFEGTGAPTNWSTTSGNPDWDYTTTPIDGSQSLFVPDTGSSNDGFQKTFDAGASDNAFVAFKTKLSALPSGGETDMILFRDSSGATELARCGFDSTGHFTISDDGGSTWTDSTPTFTSGAVIYVKCEYNKGTGSNAVVRMWASSGTSWGTPIAITDSTATLQAGMVRSFNLDSRNTTYWIDQWDESATDVWTVPEDLDP